MPIEEFIAAVQALQGLKPEYIEQLITLAPRLTDAQRSDALAKLKPIHDDILAQGETLLHEIDEGEKEIQHALKVDLPAQQRAVEDAERSSVDAIFNDDSSSLAA
jgi:hypothetical protein